MYNFGQGTDASNPYAGLIFDNAGNLYGTTFVGGIHNYGAVFELSPSGGGWTEKVLHSFNLNGSDGSFPFAGVVFDAFGNLYGTTYKGGIHDFGTVFELTPNGSGGWTEKILHSFNYNGTDAALPFAGLIVDSAGNLYRHYRLRRYSLLWSRVRAIAQRQRRLDGENPAQLQLQRHGRSCSLR